MIAEPIEEWFAGAIDMMAFRLIGRPPEFVEQELNCFCWELDSGLASQFPDHQARADAVIATANEVCVRLGEMQAHGVGRA
jgi:hypothetical protein